MNRTLFIFFAVAVVWLPRILHASGLPHHVLSVRIDPDRGTLVSEDRVTLPASSGAEAYFTLHAGLEPAVTTPGAVLRKTAEVPGAVPLERFQVTLPAGVHAFTVKYSGAIRHPLEQVGDEQARGYKSTGGIISDEGVFLSGSSGWYPELGAGLVTFELETAMPGSWDTVSQGERTDQKSGDGATVTRWNSPEPQEEIYLVAGRFTEFLRPAGKTATMVFLREPDSGIASKYLDATAGYLSLYEKLIGPYPYKKFALVENFWETGFGMPSFTLLGPTIIRLPFIINTSYPHEILHSWWGNCVFPEYGKGNWSEGLTAYLADHLLKEQQGQGAEYRLTTLQKYADYVREGRDFPLTRFTSRHSSATEAVGYGKSLLFFHMLRLEMGDRAFIDGLRLFYGRHRFSTASWEDLRASFETASGKKLAAEFGQWLRRPGAPELRLERASALQPGGGHAVRFRVRQEQGGTPYRLHIPLAVTLEGDQQAFQAAVFLSGRSQTYTLEVPGRPLRIDLDPEFDVFRRLSRDEIPPAISQALGSRKLLVVLPASAGEGLLSAYRELARSIAGSGPDEVVVKLDREVGEMPRDSSVAVLGWENRLLPKALLSLSGYPVNADGESVRLGSADLPKRGRSFVLTAPGEDRDAAVLIIATDRAEALPGLGRKLPHYHKYSYLAFEGGEPENVAKGRWPVLDSPLTAHLPGTDRKQARVGMGKLGTRKPLAELPPFFSKERMMETVRFLSGPGLKGREPGTPELEQAAAYIAEKFREAGLSPGGDGDGSYYQEWGDLELTRNMRNVIGVIPGTRPERAQESVVVGAHYDHTGPGMPAGRAEDRGKLHPGADDNASGVAVLIELARVLRENFTPRRSIVFVAFDGEELGKKGSKFYVANERRYPAVKAVGMLNLDTVGRLEKRKLLALGADTAGEWPHIFRGAAFVTGVEIEMAADDLDSGDQRSFAEAGIPAVQLFSGPHLDYHRPTDTAEKIDANGLAKVAAVAKEAVEYLADREEPLTPAGTSRTTAGAGPGTKRKVSLGAVPDFAFGGEGMRLSGVVPGSPAEQAGMKEGDVIVRVNAAPVKGLKDLSDILKTMKSGEKASVVFLREGKEMKIEAEVREH